MSSALQTAQALAQQLELSPDEGLFMQRLPLPFLAALAGGALNLVALAQEELAARGCDLQGNWVGFERAQAFTQHDQGHLDTFVADEHTRLEAFRTRWHEAHRINPEMFPLALPQDNVGAWHEMLNDFDMAAPFEMPEPAVISPDRPRRRQP